jgi:hypothetical protein
MRDDPRLAELVSLAGRHLARRLTASEATTKLLEVMVGVSVRDGRTRCHWRRSPTSVERMACDLAAAQLTLGSVDHLVRIDRSEADPAGDSTPDRAQVRKGGGHHEHNTTGRGSHAR